MDGKFEGHGKYVWFYGDVYEGEWKANKQHGRGTLSYADGTTYHGEFCNNKRHGQGYYCTNSDESIEYEGEWRDNEPVDHHETTIVSNVKCTVSHRNVLLPDTTTTTATISLKEVGQAAAGRVGSSRRWWSRRH